jgi:putative hydrolase of the HAD superfamily
MSYEAVLFDLDNTLYPYAPCNEAGKRAALDALRERGYELDRAAFDDLYATGRREAKRETRTTAACHDRHVYFKRGLYRRSGEPDVAAALAAGDAYWDGFLAEMSPCDGVEPAFDALDAAGIDVAVVTNLTTRIQLRKLTALGVDDRIDLLVTSEEVGRARSRSRPRSPSWTAGRARRWRSATTPRRTSPARTRSVSTPPSSSPTATRPPRRTSRRGSAPTVGSTRSPT